MRVEYRLKGSQLVPVCFGLNGIEHDVAEVLDCWPGEEHLYFKVRTTKDDSYILRYHSAQNAWDVSVFREGNRASRRGPLLSIQLSIESGFLPFGGFGNPADCAIYPDL